MKRVTLINIHLALASAFLPFLLIMPLSGGMHLIGQEGSVEKSEAFKIAGPLPDANPEAFFREQFKAQNIDFDFEYIRSNGKDFIFRPTSRVHYMASKTDEGATVYRLDPSWLRRLLEIHKGHGPAIVKWLQVGFALAIVLVSVSGVNLAVTVPAYRRVMAWSFAAGLAALVFGLL